MISSGDGVKLYDLAVFIGRFQPFHNGHLHIVREALKVAERCLILIGSANLGRTTRNPFTYQERWTTIGKALDAEDLLPRVEIAGLDDYPYDLHKWLEQVQRVVQKEAKFIGSMEDSVDPVGRIALVGCDKDNSTFYLHKFPQWDLLPISPVESDINATKIRDAYFLDAPFPTYRVPEATFDFLREFQTDPVFAELQNARYAEVTYTHRRGKGPFLTGDSVVVQSGHVLLVERGGTHGKGKLALPGGFMNEGERLEDTAVRELFEETQLFANYPTMEARRQRLWNGYRSRELFDDPFRSTRARIVTLALLFKLQDESALPSVVGTDDAARALWVPLSSIRPDSMFDDHGFIVERMLRQL